MDKQEQKLWCKVYTSYHEKYGAVAAQIAADNAVLKFRKSKTEYGQ